MSIITKTKDDHRYDALRNLDSHSDSSTDVEDWEEEPETRSKVKRRRTLWKKLKPYRWIIDTSLLLIIVGLLAEKRWKAETGGKYELVGDISGFAPTCTDIELLLVYPC